jgi:hypothetical protein
MKLDFTPQIEVISSLVMRGASIPVLSRRLKLKSHCAIARWLAENEYSGCASTQRKNQTELKEALEAKG